MAQTTSPNQPASSSVTPSSGSTGGDTLFVADFVDEEDMVLTLADLVPDEDGEIVLFADTDTSVKISSESAVIASGLADPHVTAAGVDVTGMAFSTFEGGITVYHNPDHDLTLG